MINNFEISFIIQDSLDGGYEAKAVGVPIFTQSDTMDELKAAIKEAVHCHYDESESPQVIRLDYVAE